MNRILPAFFAAMTLMASPNAHSQTPTLSSFIPSFLPTCFGYILPRPGIKVWGQRNAQTILLMHGLFDTSDTFQKTAPLLAQKYRVVAFDVRGYGSGPKAGSDYSTSSLAADAIALMDLLKIKKAHFVGHSLGGRVAVQAAALYPDRIHSVIVEDIDLIPRRETLTEEQRTLARKLQALPRFVGSRVQLRAMLKRYLGSAGVFLEAFADCDEYSGQCRMPFDLSAYYLWEIQGNSENLIPAAEKMRAPLLYLNAVKEGTATTPRGLSELVTAVPSAEVINLDSGHFIHDDKPETFAELTLDFLARISKRSM